MSFNVKKRAGHTELVNLDKIHKVVTWAQEELEGFNKLDVSISEVEMKASIQFYDGIPTKDIHATLVKSAADLISVNTPDYQYLAARLELFGLRKQAFGKFTPPSIKSLITKNTLLGIYDRGLLAYSDEEFEQLEDHIDHNRDFNMSYAGVNQLKGKYLVQNRVTGAIYESPQFIYMLIPMCLFADELNRIEKIKKFYDAASQHKISLPTPIMAGVRTPTRQFSSCVLIETGDSLDSINATSAAIIKYVSQRAGIGINAGAIRGIGSPIRGGEAVHTGCVPFYKHFQTAVKSCSQGGVRGGAATLFYPLWHSEVENLLVLKNNKGVDENRVRHLDYGVQFNRLMYQRLVRGQEITLFSPHAVEGLYEAFFADQEEFEKLYLKYEQDDSIPKSSIKASELFTLFGNERSSTGRVYLQNVDHCNTHSPFDPKVAPIKQSNLCVVGETLILTDKGYREIEDLVEMDVNVWNGEEWSEVTVKKTGESQPIVKVVTNSTKDIECTPYHKFYVADGYTGKVIEKRAYQLEKDDKLIKFDLPLIEGHRTLEKAYENGFYSADGCKVRNNSLIYLYGEKKSLINEFPSRRGESSVDSCDRIRFYVDGLQDKFFVPDSSYTVESRLTWLAGYLDGDGTVARNGTNESLQATSVDHEFLYSIQMMLQELGIQSKVCHNADEGYRSLPLNNGSGDSGEFLCKEQKRLLISSSSLYKLHLLGFRTKRLQWEARIPQRNAEQFIKIERVVNEGRNSDTYCFTEPKRNMGMFNGVLAGNCLEIALPTKPLNHSHDPDGEIALCTLSAFNLGAIESLSELEELSEIVVRALDCLLDYQDYPVPAAEKNKLRRTLGVGVVNYAYYLAKNGVKYSDGSANNLTHKTFEAIQYYLLKASNNLAKEKGACALFDETTYSQGILPIDTYSKTVDNITSESLHMDWEALRGEIVRYGLRNSTLTALMPSETSSQISNATNGIEPPRGLVSVKSSKDGVLKQVVPDIKHLKDSYELLWDIPSNKGYLQLVAIMQKFVDQAISANTNYDPSKFEGGKVPMKVILKDILEAHKLGIKTLYYHNTRDGAEDAGNKDEVILVEDVGCESGACKL